MIDGLKLLIRTMFFLAVLGLIFSLAGTTKARGEWLDSLLSSYSPLVVEPFVSGEMKIRAKWSQVIGGEKRIPSRGHTWDLRKDLNLTNPMFFVDIMLRFQVWRLSLRLNVDTSEFNGSGWFQQDPGTYTGNSRFEYTGVRLGGDLDLLVWGRSRAGLNMDYDLSEPIFYESIETRGGSRISQEALPLTLGIHGVLAPRASYYGISGIVDGRARWSAGDTGLTDWEIGGGILLPETAFGAASLRVGYRNTFVELLGLQTYDARTVIAEVDVNFDGWFLELAYHY